MFKTFRKGLTSIAHLNPELQRLIIGLIEKLF